MQERNGVQASFLFCLFLVLKIPGGRRPSEAGRRHFFSLFSALEPSITYYYLLTDVVILRIFLDFPLKNPVHSQDLAVKAVFFLSCILSFFHAYYQSVFSSMLPLNVATAL